MQNDTYLTDKQVAKRYNVGRATAWRWVQEGDFPKPIKLSSGCTRWKLTDLEKWETDKEVS